MPDPIPGLDAEIERTKRVVADLREDNERMDRMNDAIRLQLEKIRGRDSGPEAPRYRGPKVSYLNKDGSPMTVGDLKKSLDLIPRKD